jgi:hypothetical protein
LDCRNWKTMKHYILYIYIYLIYIYRVY